MKTHQSRLNAYCLGHRFVNSQKSIQKKRRNKFTVKWVRWKQSSLGITAQLPLILKLEINLHQGFSQKKGSV